MNDRAPSTDDEWRDSMCPSCKHTRGNPKSVSITAGIQTVTYRCPTCGTTWSNDTPDKKGPLLGQK
jgi:rubrerythrin